MAKREYANELNGDLRAPDLYRDELNQLTDDLRDKITKLEEQARIFIPLIALCLIAAIPVWSKSPVRFLALLLNPFVLLPLAFCISHLVLAWLRIVKARNNIRDWERKEQSRAN